EFHARLVTPANGVLAIYGDVHAGAVQGAVEAALGHWTGGTPFPLPAPFPAAPAAREEEARDKEQAVVVVGYPGTTFTSADRYALELIQEACSDLGSRLFLRIRDELGLAYYVGASNLLGRLPGCFAFYCGTAPGQAAQVEAELKGQAALLAAEGLTPEELSRAKAKIIGQRKIARQDLGQQALTAALDELYGLGFAHGDHDDASFEALTLEDLRAAAHRCFQPDHAVVAIQRGH
ncbi:MAG: M16 family metallopeptidase, partial [Verrucomicrobiota bacterium]